METTKIIESTNPVAEEILTTGEGEILMTTETVTEARDYWTPENLICSRSAACRYSGHEYL